MKIYINENEGVDFQRTVQKIIATGFWHSEKQDENGFYVDFQSQAVLTQQQIDKIIDWKNQAEYTENIANIKFNKVEKLILRRMALLEIINHPAPPAAMKTRAQGKLTAVNQQIAQELGL